MSPSSVAGYQINPMTNLSKVHAHRFRHTFATWAISHGARELDVHYLLGHASPGCGLQRGSRFRELSTELVWRNIFVAETDEEAANVGIPAYRRQSELRDAMRNRMFEEQGEAIEGVTESTVAALPRRNVDHALIHGSPATVAGKIAEIEATGVGGVIASFRIGPMSIATATNSLDLFMTKVAPDFREDRGSH